MATSTARLQLRKPATTDLVSVVTDLNAPYDKIDAHVGDFVCTSGTRPTGTDLFTGRTIFETDTKKSYVRSDVPDWRQIQTEGAAYVDEIFKRKTADESVTSSTTYQDDDHLFTPSIPSGTVWEFDFVAFYDGSTANDLKTRFTVPAGAVMGLYIARLITGAATDQDVALAQTDAPTGTVLGCLGAGTTCAAHQKGLLVMGGTAGVVNMQWAQFSSGATASRMFINSYLQLKRKY